MSFSYQYLIAAAGLALLSSVTNAQVGVAAGKAKSLLACFVTSGGAPTLRPEGYTELLGDIVIAVRSRRAHVMTL